MKIEIIYVPGCPNHPRAVNAVREAIQAEGMLVDIVEVEIESAPRAPMVGFLGSPTVRINGQDIELSARSSAQASGLSCRTYTDQGRTTGVPPLEWIRAALREAKIDERGHVNEGY